MLATIAEGINTGLEAVVTVVFSVLGVAVTIFVARLAVKWAKKASGEDIGFTNAGAPWEGWKKNGEERFYRRLHRARERSAGGAWWNEEWATEYKGEKEEGGSSIALWDDDEPRRDPADE